MSRQIHFLLLLICVAPVHILASKPDVAYKTIEKQIVSEQHEEAIQGLRLADCLKRLNRFGDAIEHYSTAHNKKLRPDGKATSCSCSGLYSCLSSA